MNQNKIKKNSYTATFFCALSFLNAILSSDSSYATIVVTGTNFYDSNGPYNGKDDPWRPPALYIAVKGNDGSVTVTGGSKVYVNVRVAPDNGSTGIITIDGPGSLWQGSGADVGGYGTGIVNITNGGLFNVTGTSSGALNLSTNGAVSVPAGSSTINVGGGGQLSTLNVAGEIHVKHNRPATININQNGIVIANQFSTSSPDNATLNLDGGILKINGGSVTVRANLLAGGGTFNIPSDTGNLFIKGAIDGPGNLIKEGPGAIGLGSPNHYTGQTIINGGTIRLDENSLERGTLGSGAIINNGVLQFNTTKPWTADYPITGSGAITKTNGGIVTLSGINTYSGGTNVNAGTLSLGSLEAIGSVGTIRFGSGALQFTSTNTTDYSSRFSNANSQNFGFDTNGQNTTFSSNLISSGGSLRKLGAGTLTLNGANNYSGETLVNAGTLALGQNGSLANSPLFTLKSGASLDVSQVTGGANFVDGRFKFFSGQSLRGNGTVTGPIMVAGGATLTPGESLGVLTTGDLAFENSASHFKYEINYVISTGADLLNVNGSVILNGATLDLSLIDPTYSAFPHTFILVNNDGVDSVTGAFTAGYLPIGINLNFNYAYSGVDQLGRIGDGNDVAVTITYVPEPSTIALAGFGLVGLVIAARRRKS